MENKKLEEISNKLININQRNQSIKDLLSDYNRKEKLQKEKNALFELEREKSLLLGLIQKDKKALRDKNNNWEKVLINNETLRLAVYNKKHD